GLVVLLWGFCVVFGEWMFVGFGGWLLVADLGGGLCVLCCFWGWVCCFGDVFVVGVLWLVCWGCWLGCCVGVGLFWVWCVWGWFSCCVV
ncbi:hypothetical protein, partial [Pseudomonas syringae group genomosp. 7]|uniref:hypothetical protein n=1 Tax=Pseudomonas syringae group genomosp. 7 TaxID=251699 RepID=UPI00377057C2